MPSWNHLQAFWGGGGGVGGNLQIQISLIYDQLSILMNFGPSKLHQT